MDLLERLVMTAPVHAKDRGAAIIPKSSDDAYTLWPTLYRLMTEKKIGKVERELSKLSIKLDDQGFVATLTEPASGQVVFHVSDSLFRILESLEARLVSDKPGWVPDKYAHMKKKKK